MPNITISAPPDPGDKVARDHTYTGGYTTADSAEGISTASSKSAPALEAPTSSNSVAGTVTVQARLEIGTLTSGGSYDSGFVPANVTPDLMDKTKGTWDNNFNLPAGTTGTNARITAKMYIDGTQANGTPSVEDFQVLDPGTDLGTVNPPPPPGPGPAPAKLPVEPAALVGVGAKAVGASVASGATPAGLLVPAGMEFRVFSGTYEPPVTRIACRVQRQYVNSVHTKSVADAYLFGGVWAAIILVPATTPSTATDWFIAEFADENGLVWDTDPSKIR